MLSISNEFFVAVAAGLIIPTIIYFAYMIVHRFSLHIGTPVVENPYGNSDDNRDIPKKLRFIRVPITAKFVRQKNVFCWMEIVNKGGLEIDSPGILHWQRQPRDGVAHPQHLHENLANEKDIVLHMIEYHFAHNKPIDIGAGQSDKVDLMLRVEDLIDAVPAITREIYIPPGSYVINLFVDSASLSGPLKKTFNLSFSDDINYLRNE